jgi:hypothetical protein
MFNIKPFSPTEACANKVLAIPKEIIQAVNELLAERYNDRAAIHITLKEVKARCRKILGIDGLSSDGDEVDAWPSSFWDFEPVYRDQGWTVDYDRPTHNESYDGYYIFGIRK